MNDSLAEQAIAQHVAHARESLRDSGAMTHSEADQEAAEFRAQIREVLGDRAITDDILLGVAVGIWALQGAIEGVAEDAGHAERAIALIPGLVTMQITWINLMRQGVTPAEFDWEQLGLDQAA